MDNVFFMTGKIFCVVGGIALAVGLLGIAVKAVAEIWIASCNRWRGICRAESLIHEYIKNRETFFRWLEVGGGVNDEPTD